MSELLSLIKQAAVEAVEARDPLQLMFGAVTTESPLSITVDQKLTLDESFLLIPESVKKEQLKQGDGIAVLRMQGGQRFFVIGRM